MTEIKINRIKPTHLYSISLIVLLLVSASFAEAQRWRNSKKELIFGFGATNFLGDIGGGITTGNGGLSDMNIEATSYLVNVGYGQMLSRYFTWQTDLYYGQYTADDSYSRAQTARGRMFKIKSPIIELSTKLCLGYPFENLGRRHYRDGLNAERNIQITPYMFLGAGFFYMNPMGKYIDNEWYALQPLSTEGQGLHHFPTRTKYSLLQFCIPFGIGFKTLISENWFLGVDFGLRKTFTDYMDDVSLTYPNKEYLNAYVGPQSAYFSNPNDTMYLDGQARGGAKYKDAYMFLTITFRYKLREVSKNEMNTTPGRRKQKRKKINDEKF